MGELWGKKTCNNNNPIDKSLDFGKENRIGK